VGFNVVGADKHVGPLPALTEAAGRLPIALIALLCLVAVYLAWQTIFNRRMGVMAAVALITSPFFLMVGRQAITDMPFVGFASAGLCFFMISMFSQSYRQSRWYQRVSPWVLGFLVVATLPQYWAIIRSVKWLNPFVYGVRVGVFIGFAALIGVLVWLLYKRGKDSALVMFYICISLATLGKGIGGFALPGLVILCYLLVSWDWAILRRSQLLLGTLLFVLIAVPWYLVLSLFFTGYDDEHKLFYQRFWIHDHLNRLAVGVHGETGSFDYFIRQLGFGTLPWAAVMPLALFDAMRKPMRRVDDPQDKARVFTVVWAVVMFVFFTAMQTKFHHYILPMVVPLSMLAGMWLTKFWDSGRMPSGLVVVTIFALTLLVALDGMRQPWAFVDMFTYHYISYKPDYYFPRNFSYKYWLGALVGVGMFVTLCVAAWGYRQPLRERIGDSRLGRVLRFVPELLGDVGSFVSSLVGGTPGRGLVLALSINGFLIGVFFSQVYFLQLAPHWSQRYLYDTYWNDRRGNEPNLAYLMNWRGETFYALNTDDQIKDAAGLKEKLKGPGRKYIVVESNRYQGLESASGLPAGKIEVIDRSNSKWYLVRVNE
ncbi:MAG: hypothetical protein JXR83_11075, partial [Deltaproteobacteria bacterium]|nr:hypothetical protein [Deltaproteobacteria bacterium]